MIIRDILARALHHAIQDRQALVDAYGGEGAIAEDAKMDIARYKALAEKFSTTPPKKLHSIMVQEMEELSIGELRQRISENCTASGEGQGAFVGPEAKQAGTQEDAVMYEKARAMVLRTRRASTSVLQRRLKIGYFQASRLMEMLEERGVVGPEEGSSPRQILVF